MIVGHGVVCHAAWVGDRVLIGNGATVNDAVEIGDDSLIAAGAVVLDRTIIEPESVVAGVPGKVRGRTTARHKELIVWLRDIYLKQAQRYKGNKDLC